VLDEGGVLRIRHGQDVGPFTPNVANSGGETLVRLMDGDGRLVGLAKPIGERGFLHAAIVFG
jgi:hypothetical protein